jgi:hypothetical protein
MVDRRDHNLLTPLLPLCLAPNALTQMRDVLGHTGHRPGKQIRTAGRVVVHLLESEARVFEVVQVAE